MSKESKALFKKYGWMLGTNVYTGGNGISDEEILRRAATILGRRKSPAKAKAARENLRKAAKARKK